MARPWVTRRSRRRRRRRTGTGTCRRRRPEVVPVGTGTPEGTIRTSRKRTTAMGCPRWKTLTTTSWSRSTGRWTASARPPSSGWTTTKSSGSICPCRSIRPRSCSTGWTAPTSSTRPSGKSANWSAST
uniref:(northern house mosquito) hypothetical protein n=1 Tax=Culex pipiens TaxID=7175 RepID=A0A8D8K7W0_CULPI